MDENLEAILSAKAEWDSLQPLSPEHDRRLWQKLRLEWNYHSNHIEGNTLTYGETELLLIHGQTHGNHTLREYEEMKAHDVGIAHLRELAADTSRPLGEADIRNLNKIILKEPFWKPAQTAEGGPTRKQVIPGEYKTTGNNVITATGELFEFAPPADVPSRMSALVAWLRRELSADAPPILSVLARLHHEFVLIHPFDDGNGRVARMLVNYVLMRQGYPPIIVPTGRKTEYLAALRLADAGEILGLESFLGTCIIRSLELGIKAAKGENLDEPGDVEKEVAVFIKNQLTHPRSALPRSDDVVSDVHERCLKPLVLRVREKLQCLAPLFELIEEDIRPGSSGVVFGPPPADRMLHILKAMNAVVVEWQLKGFRGPSDSIFGITSQLRITLNDYHYEVAEDQVVLAEKTYAESILSDEADAIADKILATAFGKIKSLSSDRTSQ